MTTEITVTPQTFSLVDIETMGEYMAKSKLFGVKTKEEAVSLMLLAQAYNIHPARAAVDFHVIEGKASKKAEAMLRDFIALGGIVQWRELLESSVTGHFEYRGMAATVQWNIAMATKAGLAQKDVWRKYPRSMLRNRVISEAIRLICPAAASGMYTDDEVRDMGTAERVEEGGATIENEITGSATVQDEGRLRTLIAAGEQLAQQGLDDFRNWWATVPSDAEREQLRTSHFPTWKEAAKQADEAKSQPRTIDVEPEPGSNDGE